uniref:Uncharacterized protein n=1 Tax=Romanomermis culicivorax TaxID=13658 RepID=A0A915JH60_ROMCU
MASESDLSEMARVVGTGVVPRTFALEPLAAIAGNGQQATSSANYNNNNNNEQQEYKETSFFEYDTPVGKRYLLHRIEEESEDNERSRCDRSSSNNSSMVQSGSKITKKYFL